MDIGNVVHIILYLIVVGCIFGLLLYLVNIAPVPEPWKTWLRFLVIALAVVIIIFFLLSLIGGGGVPRIRMGSLGILSIL